MTVSWTIAFKWILFWLILSLVCIWTGLSHGAHPVLRTLPSVESEDLHTIFDDPWTFWFDESNMPRAMQFAVTGNLSNGFANPTTVHDGYHRFNNIDRTTNANVEFPWRVGGGMHTVQKGLIQIVKFYWHPEHKPVRYYRTIRNTVFHRQRAWDWSFPIDSVVGEIITMKRNGFTYPFEIRTLTREQDAWQPRIYRQFNDAHGLADRIWELGHESLAHKIGNLKKQEWKLVDRTHAKPAVILPSKYVNVPELPEALVDQLLKEPLREVVHPLELLTRKTQILPAMYAGTVVGISRDDCVKCHGHVAKHVNNFDRPGRDWYGYIRGSDRIFSFHPFARSSISTNGFGIPVQFNQDLIKRGYIAPYNKEPGYARFEK